MSKFGRFLNSCLTNLATGLLSLIIVFLIIPLLVFTLSPFFLYRQFVIQLAKLFKRETLGKALSTSSAAFCSEKIYENPTMNVISSHVVEGKVDIDHLRNCLRKGGIEKIDPETGDLVYPELSQNVCYWMGYPFWRRLKGEVNLEELVHFYKNDGDQITDHKMARELIMSLNFKAFTKDKPLWELIILRNYIPEDTPSINPEDGLTYSLIIPVIHHSVADAFSQFKLVEGLSTTRIPFENVKAHDYCRRNTNQLPFFYRILRNVKFVVKVMFEFTNMLIELGISGYRNMFQAKTLCKSGERDFAKRFHGDSKIFLLSEISELKLRHGVSGTAILFAGIAGAMRRTFYGKESRIPVEVPLGFPLPLTGRKGKLRNDITSGSLPLPLKEEDGVKRLLEISRRLGNVKRSTLPVVNSMLLKAAGGMPRWVGRLGVRIGRTRELLFVSNVAGPKGEIDFCGYKVKDVGVSSGIAVNTKSLIISMLSQGDQLRVAVGADEQILESDEEASGFLNNFSKELEFLNSPKINRLEMV